MRQITVSPVLNGWLVQVGCQQLAYTDKGKLISDFVGYLDHPDRVEKQLLESAVNRHVTMPGGPDGNSRDQAPPRDYPRPVDPAGEGLAQIGSGISTEQFRRR